MRGNWLECTSGSGGTGNLSLSSSHGFPLLSAPWTGIRQVRATILEFNSDPSTTNANLIRAEDGYGPLDTSGPTLDRSDAAWTVLSSWDGTTYLPNAGSSTAPSKQSFGTVAANIRVICSWGAEDNPFFAPIITTIGGGSGHGPFGLPSAGTFSLNNSIGTGVVGYIPFVWADIGLYTRISLRIQSGFSSATSSSLNVAIYEVSKTGTPGKMLGNFGNIGGMTTAGVLTSSTLATPLLLVPGWYYLAVLPQYAGQVGSCLANAFITPTNGPLGSVFTVSGQIISGIKTGTGNTTLPDPAVAPTGPIDTTDGSVPGFRLA